MEELEIVRYARMEGMRMFFNKIDFRTFHFHEEWEILLAVENPLVVRTSSKEFVLQEGEICVLNPYAVHELQKKEKSSTFLCLQVSPDLFPAAMQLKNMVLEDYEAGPYYDANGMARLCLHLLALMDLYLQSPPNYELKASASAAIILSSVLDHMPSRKLTNSELDSLIAKSQRITSFKKFVDQNYRHTIHLKDFAHEEGCTLSYLSTFIKKELNMSFRDYVNQVRFYASLKIILDPHLKMQQICDECGFSDYRYFSAVFKENTGMSPLEFRRQPVEIAEAQMHVHQSIHSLERFYTVSESRKLLKKYLQMAAAMIREGSLDGSHVLYAGLKQDDLPPAAASLFQGGREA